MGVKRSRRESVSSSDDSTPFSRESSVHVKIVHLASQSAVSDQPAVMRCSLPPHEPLAFASFDEYDVHYQQTHVNRCSECHRNFPDAHFLSLHIAEYHDPIVASRRDKGEQTMVPRYACLLPACDRLCSTPQKRRMHCIDKHQFPRNYDFVIVKDGIDRRNSMLITTHRRKSSTLSSTGGTVPPSGRRRGESSASTTLDSMDTTEDQERDQEEDQEEQQIQVKRAPLKLRGRGGFGHARTVSSGGRGQEKSAPASPNAHATKAAPHADPVDSLTSTMSALRFVPHSVRVTRGSVRGKGRGGG